MPNRGLVVERCVKLLRDDRRDRLVERNWVSRDTVVTLQCRRAKMAPCLTRELLIAVSLLSFQVCIVVESLNNGLARTPPSKSLT